MILPVHWQNEVRRGEEAGRAGVEGVRVDRPEIVEGGHSDYLSHKHVTLILQQSMEIQLRIQISNLSNVKSYSKVSYQSYMLCASLWGHFPAHLQGRFQTRWKVSQ